MRINKFVALATGMSRRAVDEAIANGRVLINDRVARVGQEVTNQDRVRLDSKELAPAVIQTIILNKPVSYVVSRDGQGSQTIYDLLPAKYHNLKPVGRLDKDSSGLLLLTNDGKLANELTHPSHQKQKVYEIELDKPLDAKDQKAIEQGVELEDGISSFQLKGNGTNWTVVMSEGRNRQIRRTFESLGYRVTHLHRTQFGPYLLQDLQIGKSKEIL
jgi:23S rRNA pseudouridine2605 synthase